MGSHTPSRFGSEFWTGLGEWLREMQAERFQTIHTTDLNLFRMMDDIDEVQLASWMRQATALPGFRMAGDGVANQDIAREVGVSRPTVQLWRDRFLALRVAGLAQDAPRPGRLPSIPEPKVRAVIDATLHTTPPAGTAPSSAGS